MSKLFLPRLLFAGVIVFAAAQPLRLFAQFSASTTGTTGTTGGLGTTGAVTGGLGAQANANSLSNTIGSSTFTGFTQNFGSGNSPFSTGNLNLSGNGNNGIGTLAGTTTAAGRTGASGVGTLGGTSTGLGGISGLGGSTFGGGLGGGSGGLNSGLGGFGGGLGGGLGGLGGGFGGLSGGLGGRNSFGLNSFGNTRGGNQSQTKSTIRTTIKPIVTIQTPVSSKQRTATIQGRMSRLNLPEKYRAVQVTVQGRKAILTGQVESEADILFIARLLSLEPGIDAVESQLAVLAEKVEPVPVVPIP
jgi:hypothetical protein